MKKIIKNVVSPLLLAIKIILGPETNNNNMSIIHILWETYYPAEVYYGSIHVVDPGPCPLLPINPALITIEIIKIV